MTRSVALALTLLLSGARASAENGGADTIEDHVAVALASSSADLRLRTLREIVNAADQDGRLRVLSVLERQRSVSGRPVAEDLVADKDPVVAIRAVGALTMIGPGSVADHDVLDRALLNPDERVRRAAIAGIVAWRGPRHVPALAARLQGDTNHVGDEAEQALIGLTGQHLGRDPKAWTDWYAERDAAVRARLDELAGKLRSEDGRIVASAIADLAAMTECRAEVVDLIKPLLRDQDDRVAGAAYAALKSLVPAELIGVDEIKAPPAPVHPLPKKEQPPVEAPGISWTAMTLGVLTLGGLIWWLRGVAERMKPISVNEVVALAHREAGYAAPERPSPARASAAAPLLKPGARLPGAAASGTKLPKPAAGKAAAAKPPAGKPGEKVFKLD